MNFLQKDKDVLIYSAYGSINTLYIERFNYKRQAMFISRKFKITSVNSK